MEITTAQREYLLSEERPCYPTFCNSEMYSKESIKSIYEEIISHGQIFDIILDKGTDNYTRRIEAFSEEEALSLKMVIKDKFDSNSLTILRNAVQYKNIRLFFIDEADKDSYYYLIDFMHDNNLYISVFLLKDFPEDSYAVQYTIIKDIIELYFAASFKKIGIPVGYTEYDEIICFPDKMRPSDFKFISYYYAYYMEALATFIPESAILKTLEEESISLVITDSDYAKEVFKNRHKAIKGDKSEFIDFANMITSQYYMTIVRLAALMGADINNIIDPELVPANANTTEENTVPINAAEGDSNNV